MTYYHTSSAGTLADTSTQIVELEIFFARFVSIEGFQKRDSA